MISIVLNVKNGARHLARCLAALVKFDEIILLDNYSTDNTLEIAAKYPNVKIFHAEFMGMGKTRNLAVSYAINDWVMCVDCDEILSALLVDTLLSYSFKFGLVYQIHRQNYYANKLVMSSSWENDWVIRVYNRKDTRYNDLYVHESVISDGLTVNKIVNGCIYHFPYERIEQLLDKTQTYSSSYARQNYGRKHPKLWLIPFRMLFMFVKCYILKRGFKDGYEGLTISMFNAIGVWTKYIKLYELYYKKRVALAINLKDLAVIPLLSKQINQQTLLTESIIFVADSQLLPLSDHENKALQVEFVANIEFISNNDPALELGKICKSSSDFDYIIYCTNAELFNDERFIEQASGKLQLQANQLPASVKIFTK